MAIHTSMHQMNGCTSHHKPHKKDRDVLSSAHNRKSKAVLAEVTFCYWQKREIFKGNVDSPRTAT